MNKTITLISIIFLFCQSTPSQTESNPNVVPENVMKAEFKSLDNNSTIRFPEYKGKIIVAFLWASWCGPCRLSVKSLNNLNRDFSKRGVELIGLTFDNPQTDARAVRKFIRLSKPKFKLGWIKYELANEWAQNKLIVPQFILFTGEGVIIKRFIGYDLNKTPGRLREAIEQALVALSASP
jgi:thiol-disulfide isomerase/thioredoxin